MQGRKCGKRMQHISETESCLLQTEKGMQDVMCHTLLLRASCMQYYYFCQLQICTQVFDSYKLNQQEIDMLPLI